MVRWNPLVQLTLTMLALAARPAHAAALFSDTFDSGSATRWTPVTGTWSVCQLPGVSGYRYCQTAPDFLPPISLAGDNGWADYYVRATVRLDDDVKGRVGLLGRVQDKYHFYELRLEKDASGVKRWWIFKNVANAYTALASGPFEYQRARDYVLKMTLVSTTLRASISSDGGGSFQVLGEVSDSQYRVGRIGLKTKSTAASFDGVTVTQWGSTPSNTRRFGHIVLVTLENHSTDEVMGNPYMPYFNSLASKYAVAVNFYANVHPSAPNYFAWTTGQFFFQNTPIPAGTNNVVRALNSAGKSWGAFFEQPGTETNVFQYLPEVAGHPSELAKVAPFSPDFSQAFTTGTLPNYVMVHANETNNGHACKGSLSCLVTADTWLQNNIGPYIASAGFTANHDLLIIAWDESNLLDTACGPGPKTILLSPEVAAAGAWICGGRTTFIVVSSDVKPGYVSTTIFHDESILRIMLEGLGVTTNLPGASSFATAMNEFFK